MQLDRFKHEFKRLNGVYATDKVVLFRNPLELYSLTTGKIIASVTTAFIPSSRRARAPARPNGASSNPAQAGSVWITPKRCKYISKRRISP